MIRLVITALGVPRPKQSGRFIGGRVRPIAEVNRLLKAWTKAVIKAAREAAAGNPEAAAALRAAPVRLDVDFRFATEDRKRWGQPHTYAPDEDNLRKAVKDALQKAGTVEDDKRIVGGETRKLWWQTAGALMVLSPWGEAQQPEEEDLGASQLAAPDWLAGK